MLSGRGQNITARPVGVYLAALIPHYKRNRRDYRLLWSVKLSETNYCCSPSVAGGEKLLTWRFNDEDLLLRVLWGSLLIKPNQDTATWKLNVKTLIKEPLMCYLIRCFMKN